MRYPLVVMFACVVVNASSVHGEVKVETDRFTAATTVVAHQQHTLFDFNLCSRPAPLWITVITKGAVDPPEVMLSFEAECSTWQYLDCHGVHLLKDDEPFALTESVHKGSINSGGSVNESIRIILAFDKVKELFGAKKLEFEICKTEVRFKKKELDDLKAFIVSIETLRRQVPARQ